MTRKVLVACASKRGSTAEIGEAVVDALREEGLDAELRTIREARNLAPYDAVLLSDLAPSLCELLGLPVPREMTGRSLLVQRA